MKGLISLLAGIVIISSLLLGCGGPAPSSTPASTSSSPPTSVSPGTTQTSPSPFQTPQTQGKEDFSPYPGATQVSKVQTTDTGPSGQKGTVTVYSLTTNDPYEKVKAYYQGIIPSGWKEVTSSETTGDNGERTFAITAQSISGDNWVAFVVSQSEENVVSISHLLGVAQATSTTGAPEMGAFKPYPGAEVVDSGVWSGVGPNGQEAKWSMIHLSTGDPYEQVKDYYSSNAPLSFLKVFDYEETNESGEKSYSLMFQSTDQAEFYVIAIQENFEDNIVEITHNYGTK